MLGVRGIERIEIYLTNLETLKAGFLQVSSTGEIATGRFLLSRPGHMRFEYDPPSPVLIIADGIFLVYADKDLEQVTHVLQKSTPVGILAEDDVNLSGDITVIGYARGRGAIRVEVLDETGYRLKGYTKDEAVPVEKNSLHHVARWKKKSLTI